MALQGTLDTFALPDVLRLLVATKKTGCLRISGGRGSGHLWLADGDLLGVEAVHAPSASDAAEALFELLRFEEGSFTFDGDEPIDSVDRPTPGIDVRQLIEAASGLLAEWRLVEAVVPSLDVYIRPRPVIEAASVTIPAAEWSTLVAIAGGTTVSEVGDALDLAEIPVSRAVRDLVELGVVELLHTDPRPQAMPSPTVAPSEPSPVDVESATEAEERADASVSSVEAEEHTEDHAEDLDSDAASSVLSGDEPLPEAPPIRAHRPRRTPMASSSPTEERFVPLELPGHATPAPSGAAPSEDMDVDDLTAAFPGLAAQAGLARDDAAADEDSQPTTVDDDAEADLDAASPDEDAPINRGVLLKFLSSIKS